LFLTLEINTCYRDYFIMYFALGTLSENTKHFFL